MMNKIDAMELAINISYPVQEQGKIGSCVAHTVKNLIKLHGRINNTFYKDINVSFYDVYQRRTTPGLDGGMYPDRAIQSVIENGVAIDIFKDVFTPEELQTYKIPEDISKKFRIKPIESFKTFYKMNKQDLISFLEKDFNERGLQPIQFSIDSFANWWSGEYPQATGEILGGHSFVILNAVWDDNGTPRVFAIDSAYSTWRQWTINKGWRMPDFDTLSKAMRSLRLIYFKKTSIYEKYQALANATIKYGDKGPLVQLLQEYIIFEGCDIPAGPTGYFGEQTRQALSCWQKKYLKKDYGGKYWGKISQAMFKALSLKN